MRGTHQHARNKRQIPPCCSEVCRMQIHKTKMLLQLADSFTENAKATLQYARALKPPIFCGQHFIGIGFIVYSRWQLSLDYKFPILFCEQREDDFFLQSGWAIHCLFSERYIFGLIGHKSRNERICVNNRNYLHML